MEVVLLLRYMINRGFLILKLIFMTALSRACFFIILKVVIDKGMNPAPAEIHAFINYFIYQIYILSACFNNFIF